jgi:hypothetical protein
MSFYTPFVEKYSKLCAVVEDTESENPYSICFYLGIALLITILECR